MAPKAPDQALRGVRKAMSQVGPLADPGNTLASSIVAAGIDANEAAELTASMKNAHGRLERIQEQLEALKKHSAAKLGRVAGKISKPG